MSAPVTLESQEGLKPSVGTCGGSTPAVRTARISRRVETQSPRRGGPVQPSPGLESQEGLKRPYLKNRAQQHNSDCLESQEGLKRTS